MVPRPNPSGPATTLLAAVAAVSFESAHGVPVGPDQGGGQRGHRGGRGFVDANGVVVVIADVEQLGGGVEGQAHRLVESRRRAFVVGRIENSGGAGDGADGACLEVELANG